jgi:hypothetical protein
MFLRTYYCPYKIPLIQRFNNATTTPVRAPMGLQIRTRPRVEGRDENLHKITINTSVIKIKMCFLITENFTVSPAGICSIPVAVRGTRSYSNENGWIGKRMNNRRWWTLYMIL